MRETNTPVDPQQLQELKWLAHVNPTEKNEIIEMLSFQTISMKRPGKKATSILEIAITST